MFNPKSESVPQPMQSIYTEITRLTDAMCRDHLDDEYAQLCRQLAATLARKRPSPLSRGRKDVWACAIVYALGTVNFLFDKTQTPHLRADELCRLFGVSPSSAANKARQIRDLLDMSQLDPRWYRPSRMDSNPLVWMLTVNGLIVDIRMMPRKVQEEAYRKGLIPYIPGQKE
jgi:hypothetical protein